MENTPLSPETITVTFQRSRLFAILTTAGLLVGVSVGILIGFLVWGRSATKPAAESPSAAAAAPQEVRRYDIPTEGFPSLGPKDAPITIVEFSDFQCPYCQRWHQQVYQPLLKAYPNKIRFVYRNFPLTSIHPQALPAAEASLCAGDQNAYWKYHDQLFENSNQLSEELYLRLALDLGLDTAKFSECMESGKFRDAINADMQFSTELGIQSTPTFFINGLALVGAQPLANFQQIIDDELAGKIP